MTHEILNSVGIDIGTSTTQLIFSRLTVENLASSYAIPRVSIVDKQVIYRSAIHFTPLCSATEIDIAQVEQIVHAEYKNAGMKPSDLQTGAVIITGDTARKQNANTVLSALSDMAGDFVVATAGPDLESVLSARGAGADQISADRHLTVANIDIGGGTSNVAVYQNGTLCGTCCLDIGGRLIRVEQGKIAYIYPKIALLAQKNGIVLGENAHLESLCAICNCMADHLAQSLSLLPRDAFHINLYTNAGAPLPSQIAVQAITFSGGVADCLNASDTADCFAYGDIGILLGQAIAQHFAFSKVQILQAKETIRATVVGAGTHTTEVSGSTIRYEKDQLPLQNIPVLRISAQEESDFAQIATSIARNLPIYHVDNEPIAIALSGAQCLKFVQIQKLATAILQGAQALLDQASPLVIVLEADIGKALGNALAVQLKGRKSVICIDNIRAMNGDYIDIGAPLETGFALPMVIKTLIFNT